MPLKGPQSSDYFAEGYTNNYHDLLKIFKIHRVKYFILNFKWISIFVTKMYYKIQLAKNYFTDVPSEW